MMRPKKNKTSNMVMENKLEELIRFVDKVQVAEVAHALETLTREDLSLQDKEGRTVLHHAAACGNVEVVRLVLKKLDGCKDLDVTDNHGRTALHYAIESKVDKKQSLLTKEARVNVFYLLQKYGADTRVADDKGRTPAQLIKSVTGKEALDVTCARQYQIEKEIIGMIETPPFEGNKALLRSSAMKGSVFGIKYLLEKCAPVDLNQQTEFGDSVLMLAADGGHEEVIDILCAQDGIRYDCVNASGMTALHAAVKSGSLACVKKLVEKGVPLQAKTADGETALLYAITLRHQAIIDYFLQVDKGLVHIADNQEVTPLHAALYVGASVTILQSLLNAGADPYALHRGVAPINYLIEKEGDVAEKIDAFFNHQGFNSHFENEGNNLLLQSIAHCKLYVFVKILEKAPDLLNKPGSNGGSPLDLVNFLLSQQSVSEVTETQVRTQILLTTMKNELIKRGGVSVAPYFQENWLSFVENALQDLNPHILDAQGRNLLHMAAFFGEVTLCQKLLTLGVDASLQDHQGLTPLMYASKRKEKDVVQCLIKHTVAATSVTQPFSENARSWVEFMNERFVQLENDVRDKNPNVCDSKRRTLLHVATFFGAASSCRALLENGAHPNFQDEKGWTALHYAALANNGAVWELLSCPETQWNVLDQEEKYPFDRVVSVEGEGDAVKLLKNLPFARMRRKGEEKYLSAFEVLFLAAANNFDKEKKIDWDLMSFLLTHPRINEIKMTPSGNILFSGMRYFEPADFKKLLEHNQVDVNALDDEKDSVLYVGCSLSNMKSASDSQKQAMAQKMFFLLDRADINYEYVGTANMTFLKAAVVFGAHEVVKYFVKTKQLYLSQDPRLIAVRKDLIYDVSIYSVTLLRFILEQIRTQVPERFNEIICAENEVGETALMGAIAHINKETVQVLIEAGVPYETPGGSGFYPVHVLLLPPQKVLLDYFEIDAQKAEEIYRGLLQYCFSLPFKGAGLNQPDPVAQNTPLLIAVARNNIIAMQELLARPGLDLEAKNKNGVSVLEFPFHLLPRGYEIKEAVMQYQKAQVKGKAKQEVVTENVSQPAHVKKTSLQDLVCNNAEASKIKEMLLKTANCNEKNHDRETVLHLAVRHASLEVLKTLCEQTAKTVKLDVKNTHGDTPLSLAVKLNKITHFQYLCGQTNPGFLSRNNEDQTPLALAVQLGYIDMLKILWSYTEKRNTLALMELAIRSGKPESLKWLITENRLEVDLQTRNAHGDTFIQNAIRQGQLACAVTLEAQQADVKVQDLKGNTLLHLALLGNHSEIADWLLKKTYSDAFCGQVNSEGKLPLHLAVCSQANQNILARLYEKNKNALNLSDREGNTPLHLAVLANNISAVCYLLSLDALNLQLVNKAGESCLSLVEQLDDESVQSALRTKKAKDERRIHTAIENDNQSLLEQYVHAMSIDAHVAAFEKSVQIGSAKAAQLFLKTLSPASVDRLLSEACEKNNRKMIAACLALHRLEPENLEALVIEQAIYTGNSVLLGWVLTYSKVAVHALLIQEQSVIAYAIQQGQSQIALDLIAKTTPEMIISDRKALQQACYKGDLKVMAALLGYSSEELELQMLFPLVAEKACEWQDTDLLNVCVDQAALFPEVLKEIDLRYLRYAICFGDLNALDYVIECSNLDLNSVYFDGNPIVHYAMRWGFSVTVAKLIEAVQPETLALLDQDKNTVLHWACYWGDCEKIEKLLSLASSEPQSSTPIALNANNKWQATAYGLFVQNGLATTVPELNQKFIALGAELRCPQWDIGVEKAVLSRPASPIYLPSQGSPGLHPNGQGTECAKRKDSVSSAELGSP